MEFQQNKKIEVTSSNVFECLNKMLDDDLKPYEIFDKKSYIRMNMIYAFPYALIELRKVLKKHSLCNMKFTPKALVFTFNSGKSIPNKLNSDSDNDNSTSDTYSINLEGTINITLNNKSSKIFAIDIDFVQPKTTTLKMANQIQRIELFMMKSDVFFFMIYEFDFDEEVLSHPLHESLDLLTLEFRRRKRTTLLKEDN
ncbi:hypothetical protein EHP00_1490 [Ecytonucleospora hepatopenaei]|uniref:Uncharacterized protein n=1 Tax=Ecytonucleospora hepatopenaei TaxID=646526 RepID=A0A1W0E8P8_9MICR|nr:hypothetical protein EHP00_1490 [Ecytonucleospora hepatopenaei]